MFPCESPKVVQSWVDLTFSNEAFILNTLFFFYSKNIPVLIGQVIISL